MKSKNFLRIANNKLYTVEEKELFEHSKNIENILTDTAFVLYDG